MRLDWTPLNKIQINGYSPITVLLAASCAIALSGSANVSVAQSSQSSATITASSAAVLSKIVPLTASATSSSSNTTTLSKACPLGAVVTPTTFAEPADSIQIVVLLSALQPVLCLGNLCNPAYIISTSSFVNSSGIGNATVAWAGLVSCQPTCSSSAVLDKSFVLGLPQAAFSGIDSNPLNSNALNGAVINSQTVPGGVIALGTLSDTKNLAAVTSCSEITAGTINDLNGLQAIITVPVNVVAVLDDSYNLSSSGIISTVVTNASTLATKNMATSEAITSSAAVSLAITVNAVGSGSSSAASTPTLSLTDRLASAVSCTVVINNAHLIRMQFGTIVISSISYQKPTIAIRYQTIAIKKVA